MKGERGVVVGYLQVLDSVPTISTGGLHVRKPCQDETADSLIPNHPSRSNKSQPQPTVLGSGRRRHRQNSEREDQLTDMSRKWSKGHSASGVHSYVTYIDVGLLGCCL